LKSFAKSVAGELVAENTHRSQHFLVALAFLATESVEESFLGELVVEKPQRIQPFSANFLEPFLVELVRQIQPSWANLLLAVAESAPESTATSREPAATIPSACVLNAEPQFG
jgi:hypothetical protein